MRRAEHITTGADVQGASTGSKTPMDSNGVDVTCLRVALLRLGFVPANGPLYRDDHTYALRIRDLPDAAEELERLADVCRVAFAQHSTAEERAARVEAVAAGLKAKIDKHMAELASLGIAEPSTADATAPHEDVSIAGEALEPVAAGGAS